MRYIVLHDGVPVGVAELHPPAGLACAPLQPAAGFDQVHADAVEAGRALAGRQSWDASSGDFADAFARRWGNARLALEDDHGVELAVASLVIVEWPRPRAPRIMVVADFRPDSARAAAFLRERSAA